MEQYKGDRVDNSLLDLFGVEFGEVFESPSSMMRAHCNANRVRAKKFMALWLTLHTKISNVSKKEDYDGDEEENEDWNYKLHSFLKKATALNESAMELGYGMAYSWISNKT